MKHAFVLAALFSACAAITFQPAHAAQNPQRTAPVFKAAADATAVRPLQVPGVLNTTAIRYDRIYAYETKTYTMTFYRGNRAEVWVSGDGDTDLDLYVYDPYGNRVAYDDDATDECYASWNVRYTGRYTIKVVNRGSVYNDFSIEAD